MNKEMIAQIIKENPAMAVEHTVKKNEFGFSWYWDASADIQLAAQISECDHSAHDSTLIFKGAFKTDNGEWEMELKMKKTNGSLDEVPMSIPVQRSGAQ
jgi:hypothetical protein